MNLEFSNSAKYHTLIKDMGSKSYRNPMFIVGKNIPISYFLLAYKIPFSLIFAVFDTLTRRAGYVPLLENNTLFLCFYT